MSSSSSLNATHSHLDEPLYAEETWWFWIGIIGLVGVFALIIVCFASGWADTGMSTSYFNVQYRTDLRYRILQLERENKMLRAKLGKTADTLPAATPVVVPMTPQPVVPQPQPQPVVMQPQPQPQPVVMQPQQQFVTPLPPPPPQRQQQLQQQQMVPNPSVPVLRAVGPLPQAQASAAGAGGVRVGAACFPLPHPR